MAQRVVVAMSGGVDSSVAAALMVEQGHETIGVGLRLADRPAQESFHRGCCAPRDLADARAVAGPARHSLLRDGRARILQGRA